MERILRTVLIVTAALAAACAPRERTLVLLSTNDMHAKIRNFPRLAAAVEACRDTAQLVVLVDAGDRWTGNAYVDRAATPGMPMIALMNRLGYDVATLGNHEFDHGQAFLGRMIDSMDFEVVCANVVSAGAARDRHVESGDQRGVGHCQRDTRRIRLCQYADLRRRAGVYRRPLRVEFHLRRNSCLRRFGVADVDDYLESRSRRLRCGKKIHSRIRKEFESIIFFIFVCLHTIIPENRCRWIPNTN